MHKKCRIFVLHSGILEIGRRHAKQSTKYDLGFRMRAKVIYKCTQKLQKRSVTNSTNYSPWVFVVKTTKQKSNFA